MPLDIYFTRYSDKLISLSDRTKLAKALNADLFISLHCNHSDNASARGIEVYVANKTAQHSEDATWLAFQLQVSLNENLGFESRGVKFADFQVLRETIDNWPSLLLEVGFLSNKDEENYVSVPENISRMSLTILKGIYNFLKI